jgi:small subunit ribosomal protein S7
MRGKPITPRKIEADTLYGSQEIAKFINYTMLDGKKAVARKNIYEALEELAKNTKMKASEAFELAMKNVKPTVEVRSKRVGGSNYQVPVQVSERRQLTLAARWIIEAARKSRGSRTFAQSLAAELTAAVNKEGSAIKKKEEVQRMAEANKAFAQFA